MRPAPRNPTDVVSVAVDGRDNTPRPSGVRSVFNFAFALASPRAAPFAAAVSRSGDPALLAAPEVPPQGEVRSAPGFVPTIAEPPRHDEALGLVPLAFAPDGAANVDGVALLWSPQAALIWPVAGTPAEVPATRHADPEGVPAALLPPVPPTEKSSDAVDGPLPHIVPTLASVGTPGDASAVLHVDAKVGSSNDPRPVADPAKAPVAMARIRALIRESDVETLLWLASALAAGPVVVADGTARSGAVVLGCAGDTFAGALAVVPGPLAEVDPAALPLGVPLVELEAVTGSLDATVAGPTVPPSTDADPPAVEPCGSGRTSGRTEIVGSSANATLPPRSRSAMTVMISSTLLIC